MSQIQSGRPKGQGSKSKVIRIKVYGPDESNDKSGLSKNVKVDGPRILNSETGRSKNIKVDGPKVLKWTFKKCHGPKMWTVQKFK